MIKVDIISSPQVRKVGSIPKLERTGSKNNNTKITGTRKVEKTSNQNVNRTANTNINTNDSIKVDINKMKSTYTASKSYKSVNSAAANTVYNQNNAKVDTYASYKKKKYAERIKTRFDLLG